MLRSDLKPFQERAAGELSGMVQEYPGNRFKPRYDADTGELLPFLCRLRAITGAGKTPILALTANHLKNGLILWTTNRGAVISQTLSNLKPGGRYSALLPEGTQVYLLGEMSPKDWEDVMSAKDGLTIMLATVASFNQDGDDLRIHQPQANGFTRWEMLGGTSEDGRQRPLYIFYDEGHGATERQFAKLRELQPNAFVLASASPLPDDLADLLSGKNNEEREKSLADRTTIVPTKEVVEAGLLKNRLYFIDCDTAQADAVNEANSKWLELATKLKPFGITPIACFIVNETTRGVDVWEQLVKLGVPSAQIAVHLNGARDVILERKGVISGLIDTYTGKKAQDRSPEALKAGGYTHIIWNMTLREGWDEPFAYVGYVDDRGRSAIDIVQKIGRFVRQPDAQPFEDPDLNSAYFYLNVSDEEFSSLIRVTQEEMETEGYEVMAFGRSARPTSSRTVEPRREMTLPLLRPWFGGDVKLRDKILLDNVVLFADESLRSRGAIKTRVFELSKMAEDTEKRTEVARDGNVVVTPWDFLSVRLAAIDSRIVNDTGTIFSPDIKHEKKMSQKMQYASEAMSALNVSVSRIKEQLDDMLQIVSMSGRHGEHKVGAFKLVSPDANGVDESYREKYKVRSYTNSIHPEYNGMNPFEVRVAAELDKLGKPWCRNAVGKGAYRIPIPVLGSDNIWFYPDFLLWANNTVWAIDPKGKHLVEAAVAQKLLDTSSIQGMEIPLGVAFILEGSYNLDGQNRWSKTGKEGYTLVKRVSTGPKAFSESSLHLLVNKLIET